MTEKMYLDLTLPKDNRWSEGNLIILKYPKYPEKQIPEVRSFEFKMRRQK